MSEDIPLGSNWEHKKTKKRVVVLNDQGTYSYVELLHSSGKRTKKQQHYFIDDYKRVKNAS